MSYSDWFLQHGQKHRKIIQRLSHLSDEELIAYFRYENMAKTEPDFCPLYRQGKKCHEMDNLNCYLCACPNFRFDDEGFKEVKGKILKSYCAVDSEDGAPLETQKAIHQNCSACTVPHHEAFIRKCFSRDWFEIMANVASPELKEH